MVLLHEMKDMLGNPTVCAKYKHCSWRVEGSLEDSMYSEMCDALALSSPAVAKAARAEIVNLRRKCKELEEKNVELRKGKDAAERVATKHHDRARELASEVHQLRSKCLALEELAQTTRETMEREREAMERDKAERNVEIERLKTECRKLMRELDKASDMLAMHDEHSAPLVGIGLGLDRDVRTKLLNIVEIVPNLGADVCGEFEVGDVVTDIDDVSVQKLQWDEVKAIIIGPEGSRCKIKIARGNSRLEVHCDRVAHSAQHPASSAHDIVQNTIQKTSLANSSPKDKKRWSLVRSMAHVIKDRVKRDHVPSNTASF